MKQTLIIGTSLNETSKSQILARTFEAKLREKNFSCERIDLRTVDLPFAGRSDSWNSVFVEDLANAVKKSSHIVFATPIYCYDVNAAAKTVIELVGRSFTKKVVSFICTAGGNSSYMSVMGLANHLMLDFRSVIVPRFLYVSSSDWDESGQPVKEIAERMDLMIDDMAEIQIKQGEA
jgi:FMN reductase